MDPRIAIIVNPASGTPRPVLHDIAKGLAGSGARWSVHVTNGAGDAERFARELVAGGEVDIVGVCGGDGTARDVIAGLVGSDMPLAVLPGGTGNGVSGELGLPETIEAAAALIVGDHDVRSFDVGTAGETTFFVRSVMGDLARLDLDADRSLKERYGGLAYVWATFNRLADPRPATYRITVDGTVHEHEALAAMVANGGGIGRSELKLGDASMTDGMLDVLVFTGENKTVAGVANAALAAVTDKTLDPPVALRGREIVIETSEPVPVMADGEPAGDTPTVFRVLPGALRVIVPRA
jgi:YegS/Rv2252/BmrU family lipid kinase